MLLGGLVLGGAACDRDPAHCESPPAETPEPSDPEIPEPGSSVPPAPGTTSGCGVREATYEVEHKDPVPYGDQHDRQRMSVFLPVGAERTPAVIFVHGGSWWYGSRADLEDRARHFAERGIAAFSIEYRLATEEEPGFPQNVQDVVCASRYIKANADSFNIDPDDMMAYGASAGGHLAAMLGVLEGDEPWLEGACGDDTIDPKVRGVMNYFGYVDLEVAADIDPEDTRVTMMLGATWDEDPELWQTASPTTYIDRGDALFFTGHGVLDTVVRPEIPETFHHALDAASVPNVLVEVPEGLHGFYGHPELDEPVRCGFEPLADLLLGAHDAP